MHERSFSKWAGYLPVAVAVLLCRAAFGDMGCRFEYLRVGEVKPSGWIKAQMQRDLQGFAGRLGELTERASSDIFGRNKVAAATSQTTGLAVEPPRTWWNGETEGNWREGFIRMAFLAQDAEAMAKADAYVHHILKTQGEDGYLGIYPPETRYRHEGENGELWVQSRLFLALLAYYEATGNGDVLEAVQRAARLTMSHYGPGRSYFRTKEPGGGGLTHGLMFVDAVEWLYRITGDEDYRDFGVFLYQDYCQGNMAREHDCRLESLLDRAKPFAEHTPHTLEHLRVPLWVYFVTGEPEYRRAYENGFWKLRRHLVPSGACIGDESIRARPPAPDLPYEYCAMLELLFASESALQKTGDAGYAELAENVALNAAQGARLPDGKAVSYLTQDNRYRATRHGHGGRLKYSPTHEDVAVCCNPNATKLMPYYVGGAWMRTNEPAEGLAAVLYGPCSVVTKVGGVSVHIDEATDFPFGETVQLRVRPERPLAFPLVLRVPRWSAKTEVAAEGADARREGDYYVVRKTWLANDRVTLTFQPSIEPVTAVNGEVGLRRGPLLFALPIPDRRKVIKTYPLEGFADYDVFPQASDWGPVEKFARIGSGLGQAGWAKPAVDCDPAFRNIAVGGPEPIRYRLKTGGGADFVVVFGLCESWHTEPGRRVLELKVEGETVKTVDMIAEKGRHQPALCPFAARDKNGDGWLDLEVETTSTSPDTNAILNVLWIFAGTEAPPLDELLMGRAGKTPLVHLDCKPGPKSPSPWDYRLVSRREGGDFGFVAHRNEDADTAQPWDRAPIRLDGSLIDPSGKREAVSLVPIGCTVLRRVTFPVADGE